MSDNRNDAKRTSIVLYDNTRDELAFLMRHTGINSVSQMIRVAVHNESKHLQTQLKERGLK